VSRFDVFCNSGRSSGSSIHTPRDPSTAIHAAKQAAVRAFDARSQQLSVRPIVPQRVAKTGEFSATEQHRN
jgi:hypothetical protein